MTVDEAIDTVLADGFTYTWEELYTALTEPPNWAEQNKVHNWKNYVPDFAQRCWEGLALEAKAAIYVMAQTEASNEEWD